MIGFLQVLGGLALFLFGIRMLSGGMEKLAGDQIQKWLDRVTSGRIRSALFGTAATALIHSSGLLMVTMIGLINANLMSVQQAISVMLGQEIGTTLTAQIVAFNIGNFNMVFVVLGVILFEFFRQRDWNKYGEISFGIGIVFLGMTLMSGALDELMEISWIARGFLTMGQYPLVAVLAGLLMTSITQSSTAVTSMTVAMGMSNAITIEAAVGIILGSNIGSCITGLIASLRLSRAARQASLAQITINVFGVLLFLPFIAPYASLISHTSSELPRQIANAHTIFNVSVSIILFPFVKQIARFSEWLVSNQKKEEKAKLTAFIDAMQFSVPAVALTEASRELTRLGEVTAQMVGDSCRALVECDTALAQRVITQEDEFVDPVFKTLVDFVDRLLGSDLTEHQRKRCFQIKNLLMDIERVADMSEDLAQYALERVENDVQFSPEASQALQLAGRHVHQTYEQAIRAFRDSDHALAARVCQEESAFDRLYWQIRQGHIDRLEAGRCQPEADVIFTETMRVLERISDHADNLGVSVSRTGAH
ncbi:MAG: Na/Pi cotransporter family protein [Anaerolineales bacterium]|nr:Na/Pi cotransporter family protein [Anaerolineales bacterium]